MAIVKEYMDGNCKITFCDDYCVKTKEEVDKLLANAAEIYMRSRINKLLKEQEGKVLTED